MKKIRGIAAVVLVIVAGSIAAGRDATGQTTSTTVTVTDAVVRNGHAGSFAIPHGEFATVPGSVQTLTTERFGMVQVVFSAESRCLGNPRVGACIVRVLFDGKELYSTARPPGVHFDSAGTGQWSSRVTQAVARGVTAGAHTVEVQAAIWGDPSGEYQLGTWSISAVSYKKPT